MSDTQLPTTTAPVSRDRKRWSADELLVLVTFYPSEGAHGVFARLGRTRSLSYIYQKACQLRLVSSTTWTAEEEEEVERLAERGLHIDEIATRIGRTASAIEQKYRKSRFQRDHLTRKERGTGRD